MTASLTNLKNAEANLLTAVKAATGAVNGIATTDLDAALTHLEQAAENARARLAGAMYKLQSIVGALTDAVESLATGILEDLSSEPFVPAEVWEQSQPAEQVEQQAPAFSPDGQGAADVPEPVNAAPTAPDAEPLDDHERLARPVGQAPVTIAACSPSSMADEPALFPLDTAAIADGDVIELGIPDAADDAPEPAPKPARKRTRRSK